MRVEIAGCEEMLKMLIEKKIQSSKEYSLRVYIHQLKFNFSSVRPFNLFPLMEVKGVQLSLPS